MYYGYTRDRFTKARSWKDGEIVMAVLLAGGWDSVIFGIGVEKEYETCGYRGLGCWTFTIVAEG